MGVKPVVLGDIRKKVASTMATSVPASASASQVVPDQIHGRYAVRQAY
jgi:hypothetical protein